MNIKKIVIVLLFILFTSGCSVEYNLNVDENQITETIYSYYENNDYNKKLVQNLSKEKVAAFYDIDSQQSKYYTVEQGQQNNLLYLSYNYQYLTHDLQYSNATSSCFSNKSVVKDQKYITINTSEGVNCIYKDEDLQIEKLTVNIFSKFKVIKSNADRIDGNTYTWDINPENYQEKSIYIKMDYTKSSNVKNQKEISNVVIIVIGFIIGFGTLLIVLFEIRRKKNYE